MKKLSNPILVTCLCAVLGLLCLPARAWLMHTGADSKALLVGGHPGSILSWILTAGLVAVLAFAMAAKPKTYSFRTGVLSGCGSLVSILALAMTAVWAFRSKSTLLTAVLGAMAVLAALCGACLAFFRFSGKRAGLPLYLPALLTLILQFLVCFRLWSVESELQRYFFSLAAQGCVLLTLFYRACAECKMSRPWLYLLFSSGAVFFGLAALADGNLGFLYCLWAISILLENLGLRTPRRESHDAA